MFTMFHVHTHSMSMFGIQTDKPVNRECAESLFALLVFDDHISEMTILLEVFFVSLI